MSCTRDTSPTHTRWLKDMWIVSTRVHLQSHSVISCFMELCLSHSFFRFHFCLHFLSARFTTSTPNPMSTSSLLNSSTSSNPCATPQEGLLFCRLTEQSPLTACEPKSLIEVSSEYTPISYPSRKNSLDTDFNDLATTVAASERIDTADLVQLTSPLSTQEREVSANPFSVSGSLG